MIVKEKFFIKAETKSGAQVEKTVEAENVIQAIAVISEELGDGVNIKHVSLSTLGGNNGDDEPIAARNLLDALPFLAGAIITDGMPEPDGNIQ